MASKCQKMPTRKGSHVESINKGKKTWDNPVLEFGPFNHRINSRYIIVLLAIMLTIPAGVAFGQDTENLDNFSYEECLNDEHIVNFHTNNDKYLTGSKIIITGKILDGCGKPLDTPVLIELIEIDPHKSVESQATQKTISSIKQSKISHLGEFEQIIEISKAGDYIIKVSVPTEENKTESSFYPIQIRDFAQTKVGMGIFAEIFFIASLLTLIYAQLRHGWSIPSVEPFRFALLTLCSVIPIIVFIAADVELGQDAPFGFVIKNFDEPIKEVIFENFAGQTGIINVSQQEATLSKFEWMINVGGSPIDNYSTGIQIPIFVLVFGMIGGYLRFLRKTSQGWVKEKIEDSVDFFKKNNKELPKWAKKTAAELIANRYFITTSGGEIFNRIATCHICNMHKDFIQASDDNNKGEPICPECFRKKSKSCNYCKLQVNIDIKKMELELMHIEQRINVLTKNKEIKEKKIKEKKIQVKEIKELGKVIKIKEVERLREEIEELEKEIEELEKERRMLKADLEPLYFKRTTRIHRGRCQNILQKSDLKLLEIDTEQKPNNCKIGMKEGKVCNRINIDNKHFIRKWKNKSKLQKRFYPQVSRAIFNNSMEDLALIFLPPVLAFALYFVLLQAGISSQENMPTIAAVSLAVGLITKEALQRLETLGKGFLVGEKKENKPIQATDNESEPENEEKSQKPTSTPLI